MWGVRDCSGVVRLTLDVGDVEICVVVPTFGHRGRSAARQGGVPVKYVIVGRSSIVSPGHEKAAAISSARSWDATSITKKPARCSAPSVGERRTDLAEEFAMSVV